MMDAATQQRQQRLAMLPGVAALVLALVLCGLTAAHYTSPPAPRPATPAAPAVSDWHRLRIWVPESRPAGLALAREQLSAAAGGVTTWRADGVWLDDAGKPVAEPIMVVETFFRTDQQAAVVAARDRVVAQLHADGEQSVLYEQDGTPTFVPAPR
ncbi:MAG: hypothetical protein AB7K09_15585 [Planctomycetota bacterium]